MEQTVEIKLIMWPYEGESVRHPGQHPIKFLLNIDGKRHYQGTKYYVKPNQWNAVKQEVTNHDKAKFYNAILKKKLRAYEMEIEKKAALGEQITKELFESKVKKGSFFEFCKAVRPGRSDATQITRMEKFLKREPAFNELNEDFLRAYEKWHKENDYDHNTLHSTMKYLRRICNQADREGYLRRNPFDNYKVPAYIQPETIFLNQHERKRMFEVFRKHRVNYNKQIRPVYDKKYKTLVYFLLGCFTGLRHSDWNEFDVTTRVQEDNMIRLRAHKNKKWVVMEVGVSLKEIIAEIRKIGMLNVDNGDANDYLKEWAIEAKIEKDVTTHVGRHSFGYLCASELGFSRENTAYFLGVGIKTVEVYYHLTGEARKEQTKQLAEI